MYRLVYSLASCAIFIIICSQHMYIAYKRRVSLLYYISGSTSRTSAYGAPEGSTYDPLTATNRSHSIEKGETGSWLLDIDELITSQLRRAVSPGNAVTFLIIANTGWLGWSLNGKLIIPYLETQDNGLWFLYTFNGKLKRKMNSFPSIIKYDACVVSWISACNCMKSDCPFPLLQMAMEHYFISIFIPLNHRFGMPLMVDQDSLQFAQK